MLFTDYLYENSKEVWDKYLEHPLIELGEGTLDKEKFRKIPNSRLSIFNRIRKSICNGLCKK